MIDNLIRNGKFSFEINFEDLRSRFHSNITSIGSDIGKYFEQVMAEYLRRRNSNAR